MPRTWAKHTNSFSARSDSGEQFTIHEFTEYRAADTHSGVAVADRFLRTETDEEVSRLSKGEYEIVSRGIRLHSDDPNAT